MVSELKRAHGVSDALDGVRLAVGVIVHRVDAPLVSCPLMFGVEDAVHDRVAHIHVGRGHVDFCSQHTRPVGEFASLHAGEEVKIFFNTPAAEGAVFARLGQAAAELADLVDGLVVDVRFAILDELDRPLVELIKIIRGIAGAVPLEAEPADVPMMESTYSCSSFSGWCRRSGDS